MSGRDGSGMFWKCFAPALTFACVACILNLLRSWATEQSFAWGGTPFLHANYWYGLKALQSPQGLSSYSRRGRAIDYQNAEDTWNAGVWSLRTIFGQIFLPKIYKTADYDVFPFSDETDVQFCHSLLDYAWGHPFQSGAAYPAVYADRNDVELYIEACQKEYPSLSQEEQQLLDPLRRHGRIPLEVLLPANHDKASVFTTAYWSRQRGVANYTDEKLSEEELRALIHRSTELADMRVNNPTLLGIGEHEEARSAEYFQHFDVRKPKVLPSNFLDIGRAITRGEIAIFDAKPLFPAELWNITARQLAEFEGEAADHIGVWHSNHHPNSLRNYGEVVEERVHTGAVSSGATLNGHANTKRLPRLFSSLPDVGKLLGLEEDILRTESFLWMGPTFPGFKFASHGMGLHYDEEPNVYIQLAGESDVVLVPPNFTEYGWGADRHPAMPNWEQLISDPVWKSVPLVLFHMSPGDGLTFPGRTYHLFLATHVRRIALNFFFIPRWRKMEYMEEDWYSKEATSSLTRLAMRQLWARSFSRLYDETGRGPIYMGSKLEYI